MTIKFLSINLWIGGRMMDNIIEFIKREDPDIIAMTEVYDGHDTSWERNYRSMDILREALGYGYEAFSPSFLEVEDFGEIEQGNAVLSKFPIKNVKARTYEEPYGKRDARKAHEQYFQKNGDILEMQNVFQATPRNLQHVTINTGGKNLHIFNTQGPWGTDGQDNEQRLYMGRMIAKEVKGLDNVILAGDFNVQEGTRSIGLIEEELNNIFKDELKTSFNMEYKKDHQFASGFASAVVDMIFTSADVKVLEKHVYDDNVSDHLAMSIMMKI